jgi:hypothetical protein
MRKSIVFLCCALLWATGATGATEAEYQEVWCAERGGVEEFRFPDGTRCDCLTDTHAIELDFARKWPEAVGQALWYSMQSGKRAGVALILQEDYEIKYWIRLNSTILHFDLPIDTWLIVEDFK